MSALEELWLWLQGRGSRTETAPDAPDGAPATRQQMQEDAALTARKANETAARISRHARYRAGPWQMK